MIIRRYLLREIVTTFAAVMGVLLLIYLSNRFVRLLVEADAGLLTPELVFQLLFLKVLHAMVLLLPLALFLSILVALGRLYKDSEMTALAACGIGSNAVVREIMVLVFAFGAGVALLAWFVAPWAEERSYQLLDETARTAEFRAITPGSFRAIKARGLVIYVENVSEQTMENIFLQAEQEGRPAVMTATRARQHTDSATGDRLVILEEGYRYEGMPGSAEYKIIHFKEHVIRIKQPDLVPTARKLSAQTSADLWNSAELTAQAEWQWRISMPVSAILLAILAVPLSRTHPRQGRYAKLFGGILVYVIYNNLLGVGRTWMEQGTTGPLLGAWAVHISLVIIIAVLMWRQSGRSLRLPKRIKPA